MEVLSDSEKLFAAVYTAVRKELAGACGCHDFDHTLRVLRNAEQLAEEISEADLEIVRLAALLHDVARPEELSSKGRVCHARLGAEKALGLLRTLGCPEATAQAVAGAVRTHRYRGEEQPATLEGRIVYDADKLDSLGATGIGRAFLFAGREGARLHNRAEEALNGKAYGREDTAYREYLVKLRKLPEAMLTEPGRRLGRERLTFMQDFFDRLNAETGMSGGRS